MLVVRARAEPAWALRPLYPNSADRFMRLSFPPSRIDSVRGARFYPRSESGDGGQRPRLGGALGLEQVGQQEGEIDRLLGVEPRIADRVIAVLEIGVSDHA